MENNEINKIKLHITDNGGFENYIWILCRRKTENGMKGMMWQKQNKQKTEMNFCRLKNVHIFHYLIVSSRYEVLRTDEPPICMRRSSWWREWLLLLSDISSNAGGGVEQHEGAVPSNYVTLWMKSNVVQIVHRFLLNINDCTRKR